MKLIKLSLMASCAALLCASCSNYYANHAKHQQGTRVAQGQTDSTHAHLRPQGVHQAKPTPSAATQGASFGSDVAERDNPVTQPRTVQATQTPAIQLTSAEQNAKCLPAKPLGGTEQHYFFSFDHSTVAANDFTSIKNQAKYLIKHPEVKVRIEGNADDRGSREYNVALAARRAKAIITMLKQQGVPDKQFTMVSFGAEKPAAKGENEQAYHCNRRVDVIYEVH